MLQICAWLFNWSLSNYRLEKNEIIVVKLHATKPYQIEYFPDTKLFVTTEKHITVITIIVCTLAGCWFICYCALLQLTTCERRRSWLSLGLVRRNTTVASACNRLPWFISRMHTAWTTSALAHTNNSARVCRPCWWVLKKISTKKSRAYNTQHSYMKAPWTHCRCACDYCNYNLLRSSCFE